MDGRLAAPHAPAAANPCRPSPSCLPCSTLPPGRHGHGHGHGHGQPYNPNSNGKVPPGGSGGASGSSSAASSNGSVPPEEMWDSALPEYMQNQGSHSDLCESWEDMLRQGEAGGGTRSSNVIWQTIRCAACRVHGRAIKRRGWRLPQWAGSSVVVCCCRAEGAWSELLLPAATWPACLTPSPPPPTHRLPRSKEAEADAAAEPLLSSFLYASILSHDNFERSLAFVLSNRLSDATFLATELFEVFYSILRCAAGCVAGWLVGWMVHAVCLHTPKGAASLPSNHHLRHQLCAALPLTGWNAQCAAACLQGCAGDQRRRTGRPVRRTGAGARLPFAAPAAIPHAALSALPVGADWGGPVHWGTVPLALVCMLLEQLLTVAQIRPAAGQGLLVVCSGKPSQERRSLLSCCRLPAVRRTQRACRTARRCCTTRASTLSRRDLLTIGCCVLARSFWA